MRKFWTVCLIVILFAVTAAPAAAAPQSNTILYVDPHFQVSPGTTIAPGTQLTLELLPESFPLDPNIDMSTLTIRWQISVDYSLVDIGAGPVFTTEPLSAEYNNVSVSVSVTPGPKSPYAGVQYSNMVPVIILSVGTPAAADVSSLRVTAAGAQSGKENLMLMNTGADCPLEAKVTGLPEGSIAADGPQITYEWFEATSGWDIQGGVLGTDTVLHVSELNAGTSYYVCKAYFGGIPVPGLAKYIVNAAALPQFTMTLTPNPVQFGASVEGVARFDGAVFETNTETCPISSVLEWISTAASQAPVTCSGFTGTWAMIGTGIGFDQVGANPSTIQNVTREDANSLYRFEAGATFETQQYAGSIYLATPWEFLTVTDSAGKPIAPDAPAADQNTIYFDNVLAAGDQLTYEQVENEFVIGQNERFELMRGGEYLSSDAIVVTGDEAMVYDEEEDIIWSYRVVVLMGDVLGTGKMSLSQLIRVAQAVRGDALTGPYLLAADWNRDGQVDISDVIDEAAAFRSALKNGQR